MKKNRSPITTHILDVARGKPAAGVPIVLSQQYGSTWTDIGQGETDADGRVESLLSADRPAAPGIYRLKFDTTTYFNGMKTESFYPEIVVSFQIRKTDEHYHVPLLISPFGYSTYRGS